MSLDNVQFCPDNYLSLLEKLIGEAKYLQNNPPDYVPVEDRAVRHILDVLTPYSIENGGALKIQHVTFVEGRGNIIVEYAGTEPGAIVSFVGCHMDVVPANPETWDFDPFKLTRDGDKLRGRGTTDCLGHVAMLTELFRQLATVRPVLKRSVVGVWIANEENSSTAGIGVDELVHRGMLNSLKAGPLYWVDSADSQPCIGTASMCAWELTASGKLFHSGLPHKGINSAELVMEAVALLQRRFYEDFPPHPEEKRYDFTNCSTMKPTQMATPVGSLNQIPGTATISGDVRVTPFYHLEKVKARIQEYVAELNADLGVLPCRGPHSKYTLPEEGLSGKLELKFLGAGASGVACNLESPGFDALVRAFQTVKGECKPFSITGSLPCVRELQEEGYDLQIIGFGQMSSYHANNECALLSGMEVGFGVMRELIRNLESI